VFTPTEFFARATDEWLVRVRQITPDDWKHPTPCAEWDVRELVNHLVNEQLWLPPLMSGATIAEVGGRFDGDLLGDDPAAAAVSAADAAALAVPAPVAEERTVHLSFGDQSAGEYAMSVAVDLLVHSWDLAAALGDERELPADLAAQALDWFGPLEDSYREAGVVSPRAVTDDRHPQAQLLAAFGRDPHWSARV
jgi:uncharacterized protein (TIGR03086 family)